MQLLEKQNYKSLKLKTESDKDFSYFCKFLELGSMAELVQELKGKQSERNLFYIAKNNKWNDRKANFEANITSTVLDKNIEILAEIRELEIENTLQTLLILEKSMQKSNSKLQTELDKVLDDEDVNYETIVKVMKNLNQIISAYQRNKKQLKDKLVELGLEKPYNPQDKYINTLLDLSKQKNQEKPKKPKVPLLTEAELEQFNKEMEEIQKNFAELGIDDDIDFKEQIRIMDLD